MTTSQHTTLATASRALLRVCALCLCLVLVVHSADAQGWNLRQLKGKYLQGELTPAQKRDRWGFADEKERMVIKNIFDSVKPFEDSLAMVRYEGKWGVLRRDATYLFTPQYDTITPFVKSTAWIQQEQLWGVVDRNGEVVF